MYKLQLRGTKMITTSQMHICDVCRLLDYDTERKFCGYCSLCDAWICDQDQPQWGRRILAAAKRKMEFGYSGLLNYEEIAKGEKANESHTDSRTIA